jgi:hypothetical protein
MQRSSPSIAALATALAKAQIELAIPKSRSPATLNRKAGRAVSGSSAMPRSPAD